MLGVSHEQQSTTRALPARNRSENWLGLGGDILAMDVFLMVRADPDSARIEPVDPPHRKLPSSSNSEVS
jgi:hypothetical protein